MNELSIIILQHNDPLDTANCLKSLQKTVIPEKTEIIVINNGGHNANDKIPAENYKKLKIRFFDIENKGYSQGNNFGLTQTEARYYAFINPDIIVNKDTIQILLDYLKTNPHVGIVAPRLKYPNQSIQDNFRVFPKILDHIIKRTRFLRKIFSKRMREYLMWDKEPNLNEAVDWVTGAFMITSSECLKTINNHDEHFFLFMSDLDMCREAWEKGFEVHFVGETESLHNEQRLSDGGIKAVFTKKTMRIHIVDTFKYYFKYLFKSFPKNSPSLKNIEKKDRLSQTKKLNTSYLKDVRKKLQKHNPAITVFKGKIEGKNSYEQPVIFSNNGIILLISNTENKIGLAKIWRQTPLTFEKKNTFPILPDLHHLGMWSLECPKGYITKEDITEIDAILRICENFSINKENIKKTTKLNKIIGNTEFDIGNFNIYKIQIAKSSSKNLEFYDSQNINKLMEQNKLFCALSQAALMQEKS